MSEVLCGLGGQDHWPGGSNDLSGECELKLKQSLEVDNSIKVAFTRHEPIGVCGQMYGCLFNRAMGGKELILLIASRGTIPSTCGPGR